MNGIILVNKKAGQSSNKVVNKVKYLVKADKAGHLGTLDVLGEGLLPVTINKGTKVFDFFLKKDKVYKTIFKFGETTDTLDLEGEVTAKDDKIITMRMIEKVLPQFVGKQNQLPPIYSAKKVGGHTAYSLARAGKEVELSPKEIEIYQIKCLKEIEQNIFEFEVHCSSGTYIRSLARDIASALGTCGVMQYIQRTKCGIFSIKDAFTIEDVENGHYKIINLDELFLDFEKVCLTDEQTEKVLNGMTISLDNEHNGQFRVYGKNQFLGLGNIDNNYLKITLRLC